MTRNILISLFFICALTGCSGTYYSYNGTKYGSSSAALEAQASYLGDIERQVGPRSGTPYGKALVLTPSMKTCKALGVQRTGSPPEDQVLYVAASLCRDFGAFEGYLGASRVFESVESRWEDFPQIEARKASKNYDATIYFHMKSAQESGWYMYLPGSKKPMPITFDPVAAGGAPRVNSWIDSVVRNLESSR